ncbi:MAG TPA: methylated-DNA--[protein]-cysteine S-methyltransferase [Candidatus Acidoferrales bacterium]|nr:methylated-DNA--[protein]-cysteine S-methyltransferase [Candidatus Acidoferrales bacterium]
MTQWTELNIVDGLRLRMVARDSGLSTIDFHLSSPIDGLERDDANPLLREAARQLRAYFGGKLREFDIPLNMQGTPFQKKVWEQLVQIPYGETRSYSQVAVAVGAPKAVRAVGAANGSNPVPIIVPCHRVIGSGGDLTGYGGGLPLKKRLLELEGALAMPLRYA